jgi:parvulin-like peptidyl-prolyl isomerase
MKNRPLFILLFLMIGVPALRAQVTKPPMSDSLNRIEKKHKIYEIYTRLMNDVEDSSQFAAMAILYSDDSTTVSKGGWVKDYTLKSYDAAIIRAVKKLRTSEISMPIETKEGFYIVKRNGRVRKGYKIQLIFIKL